ncbi:hypothetical protein PUN4_100130 [Paraburkholderia unamae]|nr:hypothetical protein PUN4_100130 [Paraburkholderia unamae]
MPAHRVSASLRKATRFCKGSASRADAPGTAPAHITQKGGGTLDVPPPFLFACCVPQAARAALA